MEKKTVCVYVFAIWVKKNIYLKKSTFEKPSWGSVRGQKNIFSYLLIFELRNPQKWVFEVHKAFFADFRLFD